MEGEGVRERGWVMMGIINLGAVLKYGRASSVVRRAGGFGKEGMNLRRRCQSHGQEGHHYLRGRRNQAIVQS